MLTDMLMKIRLKSAFMFETLEHLNFGFVSNFEIRVSGFHYCLSFNFIRS
jgi:hypothetical protein